eukprot:TRINITY_DN3761_c0_g1_i1.p1 TRINITY_DN3761_c0_g1~~TRINITY_DN3761_c0_g1_i1.p1  ORF type:complete len:953 (-),score=178.77 TRINITY_DN3761_c0_g1_i1:52-2835(-)
MSNHAVNEWLSSIGLSKYQQLFEEQEIDDLQVAGDLTEGDLVSMGISAVGARRKLLTAVAALKEGRRPSIVRSSSVSSVSTSIDGFSLPSAIVNSPWLIQQSDLVLDTEIGRGFYGCVYRGTFIGQTVAVKKLYRHNLREPGQMDMFLREVSILSSLRSPFVVLFTGICITDHDVLIVTEYMPRGSLHEVIAEYHSDKPDHAELTVLQRVQMLRDIAHGLNYLHTRRPAIVHRDLTSLNVLVDQSWRCKLCDFGVSKTKETSRMTRHPGNLRWMAPEVTLQRPYDEKADVFSFALIMWELFSGAIPFAEREPAQAAACMAYEATRPALTQVPTMPQAVADVMMRCWAQLPQDRPSSSVVAKQLESIAVAMEYVSSDESPHTSADSGELQQQQQMQIHPDMVDPRLYGYRGMGRRPSALGTMPLPTLPPMFDDAGDHITPPMASEPPSLPSAHPHATVDLSAYLPLNQRMGILPHHAVTQDVLLLRSLAFFEGISEQDLTQLAACSDRCVFNAGEDLMIQGQVGEIAFLIISGLTEVLVDTNKGQVRIAERARGDLIGEMALLCDVPRSATVRAIDRVESMTISRGLFLKLVENNAIVSARVSRMIAKRLVEASVVQADQISSSENVPVAMMSRGSFGSVGESGLKFAAPSSLPPPPPPTVPLHHQQHQHQQTARPPVVPRIIAEPPSPAPSEIFAFNAAQPLERDRSVSEPDGGLGLTRQWTTLSEDFAPADAASEAVGSTTDGTLAPTGRRWSTITSDSTGRGPSLSFDSPTSPLRLPPGTGVRKWSTVTTDSDSSNPQPLMLSPGLLAGVSAASPAAGGMNSPRVVVTTASASNSTSEHWSNSTDESVALPPGTGQRKWSTITSDSDPLQLHQLQMMQHQQQLPVVMPPGTGQRKWSTLTTDSTRKGQDPDIGRPVSPDITNETS